MIKRPIFREHKLPVARFKDRVPIFLDFSTSLLPAQFIDELVIKTSATVDGVILSAQSLPDLRALNGQEIWVRAERATVSIPTNLEARETDLTSVLYPGYLSQNGISGIVGDLVLGGSASEEADNIQNLAFLRSLSLEIGLPLAVDLSVFNQWEDEAACLEIVELGLNLAIELGGDLAILPGGSYLSGENHIEQIASLPVLVKQPIGQVALENRPLQTWKMRHKQLDGIILTDLDRCDRLDINPQILDEWVNSLRYQSVGG